jgi:hypothetical protein
MSQYKNRFLLLLLAGLFLWADDAKVVAKPSHAEIDSMIRLGERECSKQSYVKAIKYLMQAKKEADETDWGDLRFWASYNIGASYFAISENGEALNYFYDSYKACEDFNLGWKERARVMNGIAGVYFLENNLEKAEQLGLQCYREALQQRDTVAIITYMLNLSLISNRRNRLWQTENYLRTARRYMKGADNGNYNQMMAIEAEVLFRERKYEQLITLSKDFLSRRNVLRNDRTVVLMYLMQIAKERGNTDEALSYASVASRTAGVNNKPGLYQSMSEIYRAKKDYATALRFKDSVVVYSDSLTSLKDKQLTENCLTKIEILKMRIETDKQMARLNQHKNIYMFLFSLAVLIVLFTLLAIRNQKLKNRQERILMNLQIEQQQKEKLLVERQMKESELVAHYQQEMMKRSLEEKSKALSTSTMFISSRNALIEDIIKSLSGNDEKQAQHVLEENVQHLKQLLKASNEHDNFLIEFESANPEFMTNLKKKHPNLLASDVRFLAYIHIGLTNKEISSLLNITPDSCKRRKIRLSQKLGLESATDLYGYMAKF